MPKGQYHHHPATRPDDKRLASNRSTPRNPRTKAVLELMEIERSCDAVAKLTELAIQDVYARVKRWRPDLLGPRYIRRSARV